MSTTPLAIFAATLFAMAETILNAPGCNNFVCYTPKAAMLDLLQCLETAISKSEKRMQRLLLLAKAFPDAVTASMSHRFQEYQHRMLETMEPTTPTQVSTLSELAEHLRIPEKKDGSDVKFAKRDPTETFVQSPKQVFNDMLKVIVNKDGQVYDIFSAVAIIAFHRLKTTVSSSLIRTLLLARCKLVFKGGASIGKFLFQSNPEVWNKLSSDEKSTVFNAFNKGGDNDTGLKFERVEMPGLTDELQNAEIASIIYDLMIMVKEVIAEFRVDELVDEYLVEPTHTMHELDGSYFSVAQRKANGFTIVEQNEDKMVLVPCVEEAPGALFNTVTKVEFQSMNHMGDNKLTQFYLGRVKASYRFKLQQQADNGVEHVGLEFNAYAECLDISASLIGSYSAFDDRFNEHPNDDSAKYQRVTSV